MGESRISDMASALYDGGWRAEDKDDFLKEYNLTEDEAEKIAEKLAKYIAK